MKPTIYYSLLSLLIICFVFSSFFSLGQSNTFIRTISNIHDQTISSAIELPDEGYILTTTEKIDNKTIERLVKINLFGDTLLTHSWNIPGKNSWLISLLNLQDGNFLGIGSLTSADNIKNKFWIVHFTNELIILNEKEYEVPYNIFKISSCFDHQGNIIINGFYNYTDITNQEDIFIWRLSPQGDSLNYSRFEYPSLQWSSAIMEKLDSTGYYMPIWGRMTSSNYYLSNMVELDYDFNITFEDSITNDIGIHNNIRKFNDDQYLLSGQTYIPFMPYDNEFIAIEKLDKEYHAANYQRVGPYQVDTTTYPAWIQNLDFIDTTNIFCGGTVNLAVYLNSASRSYLILANLDNELNKKWQYFYGLDKYYEMHGILASSDGGCLLLATSYNFTDAYYERDIILIKVDSNGLVTGMNTPPGIRPLNAIVCPNPGHEYLDIQSGPQITGAQFTLYDMLGKPVKEQGINSTQLRINTSNLPSGAYPWQIVFKNKLIETGKWVKE